MYRRWKDNWPSCMTVWQAHGLLFLLCVTRGRLNERHRSSVTKRHFGERTRQEMCVLCFVFIHFVSTFFLFINICSCIRGMTNTQSVSWNQFYKWHSRLQISVGSLTGSRLPNKGQHIFFFFPLSSVFGSHFISPVILHVTLIAFDKLMLLGPSFFLLDISDCIDIYIL